MKRTYKSWEAMHDRCRNPKNLRWEYYGARGISVCARWHKFENFRADMGDRPEGTSLDRIDGNGNYEPGNCRWATIKEQRANRRVAVNEVWFEGKTLSEWSKLLGVSNTALSKRIKRTGTVYGKNKPARWQGRPIKDFVAGSGVTYQTLRVRLRTKGSIHG